MYHIFPLLAQLLLFKWLILSHCAYANKTHLEKDTEYNLLFFVSDYAPVHTISTSK